MANIYYLNTSNTWSQIANNKIVHPISYTFGIDGGTDTIQLSVYSTTRLKVDTPIKITHGTNTSFDRYFIINDVSMANEPYTNNCMVTYNLVEPLELLRGYKLQQCVLKENRYDLLTAVKRLFALAKFDANVDVTNVSKDAIKSKIEFPTSNLYIAMHELARMYDCVPYLDFSFDRSITHKHKWVFKLDKADTLNKPKRSLDLFTNPINMVSETGEGLAKRVYCETQNIRITQPITEPDRTTRRVVTTTTSPISKDNYGIQVNNSVNSIKSIKLYGFNFYKTGDAPRTYFSATPTLSNNPFEITEGQIKVYALNYNADKWHSGIVGGLLEITKNIRFLNILSYNLLSTQEQEDKDICYITYDDNFIYLKDLYKLAYYKNDLNVWTTADGICKNYVYTQSEDKQDVYGGILFGEEGVGGLDPIREIQIFNQITYYGTTNSIIPFVAINDSEYDDTCYYNQSAKQIDPDKTARFLQTYIDNMASGTIIKDGIFTEWTNIPFEAEVLSSTTIDYIVNSVTIEEHISYYKVTCQLAPYHSKRRDYIEADTDIKIADIEKQEILDTHFQSISIFELGLNESPDILKDDARLMDDSLGKAYHRYLIPQRATAESVNYINLKIRNYMGGVNEDERHEERYDYLKQPSIIGMGTNILFNERAYNNFIWNDAVVANYTNKQKELQYAYMELTNNNEDYVLFDASDDFKALENIGYRGIVKDAYETWNYTLQLAFKGVKNTIVKPEYVNDLLQDKGNNVFTLRLYDRNIGKYDDIPTHVQELYTTNITLSGNYITFTSILPLPVTTEDYKAIALCNNGIPLIIRNYATTQNEVSSIRLYVSSYDGYTFSTGVRGSDPE